ncbi:SRPBCC family protein [Sphingobacterium rhinopitheci]|uniref:SRPBCC family protein n=1 Tax=Sphingobacterium rhinopitheci TaxID=2781960 RepID=UPI001F51DE8E|nr:SRPBCC family protein [Sphingobacterium rhinopitheci]MCI0921791.1 SRPBCC family protein [Sphingobacterium rhinopitheci]
MAVFQNNVIVDKPLDQVYQFLADLNNHEQLMPDNIYNWSSTTDEANFTIKNMAKLALKVSERVENVEIICTPVGETPFAIKLSWKIESIDVNQTKASFVIDAELNMMMKMVASGPLQKLVDHQVNKLKDILG